MEERENNAHDLDTCHVLNGLFGVRAVTRFPVKLYPYKTK